MQDIETILPDYEIHNAWGNADFGSIPKRDVIKDTLLKLVCGYSTGKTAISICLELNLIIAVNKGRFAVTVRGREYLYQACKP